MSYETRWDEGTIGRLRDLWAQGYSAGEIGRRMGFSKNAIVGKAHRLNLPGRPSPIVPSGTPRPRKPSRARGPTLPALKSAGRPALVQRAAPLAVPAAPHCVAPPAPAEVAVAFLRARAALAKAVPRPAAPRACCWPIGEPRAPSFRFCDAESERGRPYCAEHCQRAYVRVVAA